MAHDDLAQLRAADLKYHLHPFTTHAELQAQGTHLIREGRGVRVLDQDDRLLLDGLAGLWCVNVGYNCAAIVNAVTKQMIELPFYPSFFNSTTAPTIRLAEKLAQLAPARLNHSFFNNSGSESNESALKLIRGYWKLKGKPERKKILTREYAYHGVTLATTSMTGLPGCYLPFDLPLPGFIQAPAPYPYAVDSKLDPVAYGKWCIEETEKLIVKEGPESIAALFAEPIQGAGGVIVPPEGYLPALRELARKHGILFVADEVITGFGRLGDWFASNLWNLDPDMMILAKGLTSGYIPMGATMVSDEIAETLQSGGYLAHGYTYSGHPTAAAAALANIEVIEQENLCGRVKNEAGPYFQKKLREFASHPAVSEVRGFELIGALELLPREGRKGLDPKKPLGVKAAALVRKEGAIVRGIRDLIALAPPLIITREEIDELFDATRRGLDQL